MSVTLKKIFFAITFNTCLFFLLMIGIQNSTIRKKVNLFITETIALPISFIVGVSYISGSLTGNLLRMDLDDDKF